MFLTYAPADVDAQKWQFTLDSLMSVEAEAVERQTGWAYPAEFGQQLVKGSIIARKSLLWVFLKRGQPTLTYRQVDVPAGAIAVDFERSELVAIREAVEKDTTVDNYQQALDALDGLIAKEPESADPKAPEPDDGSS